MKGLERFLSARMDGELLSPSLLLFIGMNGSPWWKFGIETPNGRIDSPHEDMRLTVGLDVTLVSDKYDDTAALIFTKLQEYAKSIVFVSLDLEDGLVWIKGQEIRTL